MSVIRLASTAPDHRVRADLEWFFTRAHAELSVRSNFLSTYNALVLGGPQEDHRPRGACGEQERIIEAYKRFRGIEAALWAMDAEMRQVLVTAYSERGFTLQCRNEFRDATPLIGQHPRSLERYREYVEKLPRGKEPKPIEEFIRNDGALARAARAFGESLLLRACRAYSSAVASHRAPKAASA